jgi:hypothetical protein
METIQNNETKNYDRYVFLSWELCFKGLNFHQGLDDLDYTKLSDSCDKWQLSNNLVIEIWKKAYLKKINQSFYSY